MATETDTTRSRTDELLAQWKVWLTGVIALVAVFVTYRNPGIFGEGWSSEFIFGVIALGAFLYGYRNLGRRV